MSAIRNGGYKMASRVAAPVRRTKSPGTAAAGAAPARGTQPVTVLTGAGGRQNGGGIPMEGDFKDF